MSQYGFRVHTVLLRESDSGKNLSFENISGDSYLDIVKVALGQINKPALGEQPEKVHTLGNAFPISVDDDVIQKVITKGGVVQDSILRFEKLDSLRGGLLIHSVFGIVGDHETGIDPKGKAPDINLSNLAAAKTYRTVLIPPESGERGLIVFEVISRTSVYKYFSERLFRAIKGKFLKLIIEANVADSAAFDHMIKNATITGIDLFKKVPGDDSLRVKDKRLKVSLPITKHSLSSQKIRDLVTKWFTKETNEVVNLQTSAKQIASVVLTKDFNEIGFDDVGVKFVEAGRTKTISPDHLREGLIYDVSQIKPTDDNFLKEVATVVGRITPILNIKVSSDWYRPASNAPLRK